MLSTFRRWLWNRRRSIFRFRDGSKIRAIDPIAVAIALHEHPQFTFRHLQEAASGDRDAMLIVAGTACDVFGVHPLAADGKSGLTIPERLELMLSFDVFCAALKKNTAPSPIPPDSTGSISPESSEPITSDSPVSG